MTEYTIEERRKLEAERRELAALRALSESPGFTDYLLPYIERTFQEHDECLTDPKIDMVKRNEHLYAQIDFKKLVKYVPDRIKSLSLKLEPHHPVL